MLYNCLDINKNNEEADAGAEPAMGLRGAKIAGEGRVRPRVSSSIKKRWQSLCIEEN